MGRTGRSFTAAAAALVASVCGGAVLASEGGVVAVNGDKLTAEVGAGGDVDAFALELSEGARLDVGVKAAKGAALLPDLRLRRPDGGDFDVSPFVVKGGTSKPALKKLVVPEGHAGVWVLEVAGLGGSAGGYTLSCKVKHPAGVAAKKLSVGPAEVVTLGLPGDDGALATIRIRTRSGPGLAAVRLLDPAGAEVPGAADALFPALSVKGLPLDGGFGRYALELTGGADGATVVDVSAKVKLPSVSRRKAVLPPEGAIDAGPVQVVRQEDAARALVFTGTGLLPGTTAEVSGAGVAVTGVEVGAGGTSLTVTLAAEADAPIGLRDLLLCPPPLLGEPIPLPASLVVHAPDPAIQGVSPSIVRQGDTSVLVTLTGAGFRDGGRIDVAGDGLTVGATEFVSAALVRVPVTFSIDATIGGRDVTFTQPTAAGGASVVHPSGLAVLHPVPRLDSISPTVAKQSDGALLLTLAGDHFREGGSVHVSGAGVTVSSPTRVSATEFRATLAVAADAAFGARDVTYAQPLAGGGAVASLPGALTLHAPDPQVDSASPAQVVQGAGKTTVTVDGTGFRSGGTLSVSGAGLTVGATTFVSATRATVDVTADVDAALGTRDVTFTQPAEGGGAAHTAAVLAVHAPAPTLTDVSPDTVTQGDTGVVLTLTGTGFRDGGTVTLGSGFGIVGSTRVSDTEFRVTVDVGGSAALGAQDVTYAQPASGGGASATLADALQVDAPAPTVTGASPLALRQGESGTKVTVTGTNFRAGGAISISGTGLTVGATTVVSATQAEVSVSAAADAAVGARDVTFSQSASFGGASATRTGGISVHHPDPTLASVSPATVPQSGSGTFTLTGTGFRSGGAVSTSGSGVTLSSPTYVSDTQFQVSYTVAADATQSFRSLTYTQPAAGGGASVTRTSAYEVTTPAPAFTSITPSAFRPGDARVVAEIVGLRFDDGTTASVSGSGVTVHGTTYVSSTKLTVELSVASSAALGQRDLTLALSGGSPSAVFDDVLAVAPADPIVTGFSHGSLAQGASSISVTVSGHNFRSGDTLSASGSGLTFSSVTVSSDSEITASASVTSGATTGLRDVTVAHASSDGGRSGKLAGATRVVGATPSVSAVSPSAAGRTGTGGATREVPVTVTGTNFMTGATLSVSRSGGSGVTVVSGSVEALSDTTLTARLAVTGAATTGLWDLKVTNPGALGNSGTTGNSLFDVKSETTLVVNRVIEPAGDPYGGERVTVEGAGFVDGAVVDFGAVRGRAAQFLDQNTIVVTVPEPASQSPTQSTAVDVKVTNPSGSPSSATLTGGYTYGADDGPFEVVGTFPAQGATGIAQNLKSAVVFLSAPADTTTGTYGTTLGTNCYWYESGGFFVSGGTRGFGPGGRFLVLSRTGGGNLPKNSLGLYVLDIPTALDSIAGTALTPARLASTGSHDQYTFTISTTTTDTTAPTLSSSAPASAATGVDPTTTVSLVFSEELDPLTVSLTNITFKQGTAAAGAAIELADDLKTVTITPDAELAANTTYTVAIGTSVADLCGNTVASTVSRSFTTSSSDATAPTLTATIEGLPADLDGSGTYVNSSGTSGNAFDLYLPRWGYELRVAFADAGGAGIDETTFSAKCSAAVGSTAANSELASSFTLTPTGAVLRIPSSTKVGTGDDVTFTFSVKDRSSNKSSDLTLTVDVVDRDTTVASSAGGDHDPFDARRTWILRGDLDAYTSTITSQTSPTKQAGASTTVASNNLTDLDEALRLLGLGSGSMTSAAADTTNGLSRGTNAIVRQLYLERTRALLRARYGIEEDGTRGADSVDVEFLLPGEQGSLSALPTYSTANSASSSSSFSELSIGGTKGAESGAYTIAGPYGQAWFDDRNLSEEANLNTSGSATGVYLTSMFKFVMNGSNAIKTEVSDNFVAVHGGTPVGEHASDDDVLSDSFDRTTSVDATHNARYDDIMDAIELCALFTTAVAAHEIGHSTGLVPDGAPKTGLFGGAHHSNTFTEATSTAVNTSHHLDYLGNDLMGASVSTADALAVGADLQRFSPLDMAYLLNRIVHDEGK